jgi:hypothetical protein
MMRRTLWLLLLALVIQAPLLAAQAPAVWRLAAAPGFADALGCAAVALGLYWFHWDTRRIRRKRGKR